MRRRVACGSGEVKGTEEDDDKQATATTTGLARLGPGLAIRGADVLVGSRLSPVDGMPEAEILASKTCGVPKKEMSGPASPLGEAYKAGPFAAQTRSASRAGGNVAGDKVRVANRVATIAQV